MAFTSNTNNNSNEVFSPTVYCPIRLFNSESRLDKSCLSFRYWQNLLVISMNPIIVKDGSNNKVDTENSIDLYLSPIKASILLNNIKGFRAEPDKFDSIGVSTNKGVIYLADGHKCFPSKCDEGSKVLIIKKVDQSGGNRGSECAYEFFNQTGYGIANFVDTTKFIKTIDYNKDVELDMFCNILATFVQASSSAMAASVMDANKYNADRYFKFIKDAKSKLGIDQAPKNFNKSGWFDDAKGNDTYTTSKFSNDDSSMYDDITSIMD